MAAARGLFPNLLAATLLVSLGGLSSSLAQQAAPPAAPAAFDPSEVYFQGWLLSQDAEKLAAEGKHTEALEKLQRALQLFDTVSRSFPEWKKDMVSGRREKTLHSIAKVRPEALKEREEEQRVTAEIEGRSGVVDDGQVRPLDSDLPVVPVRPARPVETLESRRIAELQRQVQDLESQVEATRNAGASDRAAQERMRDVAVAELHKARTELDRLRRRTTEGPVQDELDALARRINSLEDEKAVMGRALDASRQETAQAKATIDALQQERGRLMKQVDDLQQQVADVNNQLEIERETSNNVVAGQLQQIKELQGRLRQKDEQLATANRRIRSLETELDEVRASFDELSKERNELLRERDQMAALLKLNEAGQLQEVIDQNMALDRELRETKERYELLQEDTEATKDDLLEALRDLAISKLRIQEFRREKTEQQQRITELQERLRLEESQLDSAAGDPAEVAMLRGIIQRQLAVQEKRAEARDLLMETLSAKAREDENIRRAVQVWQSKELDLSPEELRVIDGKMVDGVIISPYRRERGEVERRMADLDRELAPYENAGIRAYRNGRLRAAREAFEMIIERHPGDDTAMCKLGLVEKKLGNPIQAAEMFRRATEIDPNNPYAHRMLGHLLSAEMMAHAEGIEHLRQAVDLAPTVPENRLLLGNACFRNGDYEAAREAFLEVLSLDPTNLEAHFNLAMLHARLGEIDKAREHYHKALELGAVPNDELDKLLEKAKTPR